ncbi:TatD family hydrolase [bacterium]|nr:TatD family hydrolase [bacterium]
MYSDAHLHLVDLEARDPDFAAKIPGPDWRGAAAAHDVAEFERSEALRKGLPPTLAGFGIHPQGLRWDTADYLGALAAGGRIAFIGEAGFDFFGDRPERVRNDENLRAQRGAFEFQLALAERRGLPLLVHARKATDILQGYAPRLRKLPSVIFHGWPGRLVDAESFLRKGVEAYFSLGPPLRRGGAHAIECCAALPADRLLAETDAPWQPPRGQAWTGADAIVRVSEAIGGIRGLSPEETGPLLRANFFKAFGSTGGQASD